MGDKALHMNVGEEIDLATHQLIIRLCHQLKTDPIPGVIEWVPSYQAVTLFYQPSKISYSQLVEAVKLRYIQAKKIKLVIPTRRIHIPVLYGERWGPDLEQVAKTHQLSCEQVIQLHTQPIYLVYMIGFTPGFPYLGGMSEAIATPRKKTPRTEVPSGSVGIADQQTGIYSLPTPGGWNLIGRTPIHLFDPKREPAALLQAGDQIVFETIDDKEYEEISLAWEKQAYQIQISVVNLDATDNH